ncbi:AzlC family ABC transporter permease [Cryobacterium sp. TMT3-29-2]|uniref:AzlC family ABC transporter permease n=1 Tax=Cryobacterium sp. TMT3-29-2 TaxID=2555867 RepID=UPI0010749C86|nr:AzlC family ABC transporter permease [Cryobacterium sp. TMT3-29-2]TFC91944.1 branched-chain amino acid ABC transporter permease [Cryobacterium sp. TMT3-29-2]
MRSPKRTVRLRASAIAIASAVLVVGVAYGSAALAAGFPPWLVILAAILVLSASSELLFVGVIAAGGLPWVAVAAALLVNLRNIVYGFSASSFLPAPRIARYLSAHLVNDESVAFALAQPRSGQRLLAFRVAGVAILIAWPLGAAIGVLVGYVVPDPARLGLDAAFPAIFLAILLGSVKRSTVGPAVAGATIALAATPFVAAGLAPILGLAGLLTAVRKRGHRA